MSRDVALLLKDADGSEAYVAALASLVTRSYFIPVLSFAPSNERQLQEALQHATTHYCGIALTSQRAAASLAHAITQLTDAKAQTLGVPCFAVGRRTASVLLDAGFADVRGQASGSADELASAIIDYYSSSSSTPATPASPLPSSGTRLPLLFLCGDKRLETLPARLACAGLRVVELQVYASAPRDPGALWADVVGALRDAVSGQSAAYEGIDTQGVCVPAREHRAYLVLFSPSGVATLLAHEKAAQQLRAGRVLLDAAVPVRTHVVALGPTTAASAAEGGMQLLPGAVAATPDPGGVAAAVHALQSSAA